jgi:hypothetical protein
MLFSKREYKSGTRYCFWRWTFTPSGYITRLHLIKTMAWAVCIHFINGPDAEPDKHDHPVTFLSFIPWGWYIEERDDGLHKRRWFNLIRSTDRHRIVEVKPGTITIAFMSKKLRDWGFHTKDGWVYWKDYNKKYKSS